MITLSNNLITVRIAEHGAELQSIRAGGHEYLWQGDPEYWGHLPRFLCIFLPGMQRNEPYQVHFRPLFLPGMLGNAPYLVRFHGITVTGGDGRGGTCQGFWAFSYQVCPESCRTWCIFDPFSYQVCWEMRLTWYDFTA